MKRWRLFVKSIQYSINLLYRSSKLWVLLYSLLHLLCSLIPLLSTFLIKCLLDALQNNIEIILNIALIISLYIALLVVSCAINSFKTTVYDTVTKKAEHLYDCELSEKLSDLPLSFIDTSEGKDIVEDVRYNKEVAVSLVHHIIRIISSFYTFLIAFITLMSFSVLFSLIFLALTLPGVIADVFYDKKSDELRRKTAPDVRKFCYYRWMLTDSWPAKDIRMYDLTVHLKKRYDEEKSIYRKENAALDRKKTVANLLAELVMRSGEIVFTVFVVFLTIEGKITIGDATMYIGFAITAAASFQGMTFVSVLIYARVTETMGRLFDFLDICNPQTTVDKRSIDSFESIAFENVYFKYPLTEKYVLSGISFSLNRGDKLSIVGVNGSGKSTIVKLMLGLYEIESGSILINGYPMNDYDINDVRRMFSVLFQTFVQYPLTLKDNIVLSDITKSYDDSAVVGSLMQSGVYSELLPKLENGLDSYMTRNFDDNGTELSKGQWQKVALSRAYYKNAPIIIFDEPSAALDAEAEDKIFKNFEAISENKTGIMISHRISAARMSNKIIVIDNGSVVEQGTHDELVLLNGLYSKLYNLQKAKYVTIEEDYE